jgi:hypothetical protein
MRVYTSTIALLLCCACGAYSASAETLQVSIGIRETGSAGAIFGNGTATGGIEFVNLDGQTLTADGTWQLFTFTPAVDTLTGFAGTSANGMLEAGLEWGTLEMIRVRNIDGITLPIRLWVDNVTNTDSGGATVEGFESSALGAEVMFQEPGFSGSTASLLAPAPAPNLSAVTDTMAFAGSQSYQMDFQFIDAVTTNWVRLTTFSTPNLPNPRVHLVEPGAPLPTISFYAKASVVPEPGTIVLLTLAGLGVLAMRRRG